MADSESNASQAARDEALPQEQGHWQSPPGGLPAAAVDPRNNLPESTKNPGNKNTKSKNSSREIRIPDPGKIVVLSRPAFSRRALWLGTILVAFIAAFTPYNDYILKNTFFIGNHFPIGVITIIAAMVLVVNPLIAWFKGPPFSTSELVVVLSMMLVGAGVPSSGLMRYWEPMLVSPFYYVRDYPWLRNIIQLLPRWAVPATDRASPLVENYILGVPHGNAVPWLAFLVPALAWGVLIAAILGASILLAAVFRKQWLQNERLSYPLAHIPLELLAAPEPGRFYNQLWRNPILWSGAAIPVFLYLLSSLHGFFPAIPFVSMSYHFHDAFTEKPWDAVPIYVTDNRIYWSVLGLSFFIPSEVAFSLWFFLLADAAGNVLLVRAGADPNPTLPLRGVGMYLAYFVCILWLARRHLAHVMRSALRNAPRDEGEFAGYRFMLFGYLACMAVAWIWLMVFGVNPWVAALVLALGTILYTLMSRIIAETGLFFLGSVWSPTNFLQMAVSPKLLGQMSFYGSAIVSRIFFTDMRETLMPFATNALAMGTDISPARRHGFLKWMFIAVALSVVISGLSQHYLSYSTGRSYMDDYSAGVAPVSTAMDAYSYNHAPRAISLSKAWWNIALGCLIVTAVAVGRLIFVRWPFHPIGLLLVHTWPLHVFWFSIFSGWLVKQAMLRYGGAFVFRRARAFFIGLIVGEILTAGVWMFIGLISGGGAAFKLLPG